LQKKKNTHKATSRGFAKNKYPQAKVKFIGCQKNNVIFFLKVYFQDIEFFLWALKAFESLFDIKIKYATSST
jgi:hypothetical protein